MQQIVPHRRALVALSIFVVGLAGWPVPTGAQISTVTITSVVSDATGTATGTLGSGITTVLGGTGDLGGTPGALGASALTGQIPGLLTGEVLHAATIGGPGQVVSDVSTANLVLEVGGTTIEADLVTAKATSSPGAAGSGSASIVNLSINGVPIAVSGAPNQTIAILGGQVAINEVVQSSPTGVVVNALHITVPGAADVIIASAAADASTVTGQASAVQAAGL